MRSHFAQDDKKTEGIVLSRQRQPAATSYFTVNARSLSAASSDGMGV